MKNILILSVVVSVLILSALSCGGGGSSPVAPGTTTGTGTVPAGDIAATVTITASGVSDPEPRISTGERIRFTNNDSRAHQILTTPHLIHTDCPALNSISELAPGQSRVSEPLTTARGCGFHDHLNPDDNRFRGQVLVGFRPDEPPPPTPGY